MVGHVLVARLLLLLLLLLRHRLAGKRKDVDLSALLSDWHRFSGLLQEIDGPTLALYLEYRYHDNLLG